MDRLSAPTVSLAFAPPTDSGKVASRKAVVAAIGLFMTVFPSDAHPSSQKLDSVILPIERPPSTAA